MTVPGVDMANHSFSPNAAVRCRLCLANCCSSKHCHQMQWHMFHVTSCAAGKWGSAMLCHAVPSHCPTMSLPCPLCAICLLCSALDMSCKPCPALPCPALPCPALPCPALPCPALCDGLVTFGTTVTGVCTALRPVKGGKQKRMCVNPLQHSLPCFNCCQNLTVSGKLLLSPAPLHQMVCHNACMSGMAWARTAQCSFAWWLLRQNVAQQQAAHRRRKLHVRALQHGVQHGGQRRVASHTCAHVDIMRG